MKLGIHRILQSPREAIGQSNSQPGRGATSPLSKPGNNTGRHRKKEILYDKQCERARKQRPDRPQDNERRVEMVTEQVETRTLDTNDRADPGCVALCKL